MAPCAPPPLAMTSGAGTLGVNKALGGGGGKLLITNNASPPPPKPLSPQSIPAPLAMPVMIIQLRFLQILVFVIFFFFSGGTKLGAEGTQEMRGEWRF